MSELKYPTTAVPGRLFAVDTKDSYMEVSFEIPKGLVSLEGEWLLTPPWVERKFPEDLPAQLAAKDETIAKLREAINQALIKIGKLHNRRDCWDEKDTNELAGILAETEVGK